MGYGIGVKQFTSELEQYPGSFSLPDPFLDRHMRVWWEKAITPLKKLSTVDFEYYDGEWQAAVDLITQFGAWDVEGMPIGDLTSDSVPMSVKNWVMQEAANHIYPFLPLGVKRRLLGIT